MRAAQIVALMFALVLSPEALAGKKKSNKIPEIQKTGISEFDPTFMDVKSIHDDLDTIRSALKSGNQNLATALDMPRETSLDESLAELKKRANNKINYTLENGAWPKLKATDAVPSDVQAGIDAVNNLVDSIKTSSETLAAMPAKAKELGITAAAFPADLNMDLLTKNNLTVDKLPTIAKKLKNNAKAIKATPERIERVTDQTVNMVTKVTAAFPKGS